MSILLDAGASPSASHDICGRDSLRFLSTWAGPIEEACSPTTFSCVGETRDDEGAVNAADDEIEAAMAKVVAIHLLELFILPLCCFFFVKKWREVDDALDSASRGETPFAKLASFLGGKGGSLKRLDTLGYETTFVLEGYVCRGGNVRLMKRFDTEWAVFAENDKGDNYIQVGTAPTRPSYQDVDQMLQDNNISFKYARDIGLAPKLE